MIFRITWLKNESNLYEVVILKKKHEIARSSMSSICASFSGLRFSDFRRSFSISETFALAADIQATLFL